MPVQTLGHLFNIDGPLLSNIKGGNVSLCKALVQVSFRVISPAKLLAR